MESRLVAQFTMNYSLSQTTCNERDRARMPVLAAIFKIASNLGNSTRQTPRGCLPSLLTHCPWSLLLLLGPDFIAYACGHKNFFGDFPLAEPSPRVLIRFLRTCTGEALR
jgi:hypothetical protein